MKKCKHSHEWVFLNKRFDDKEKTIVAFCDDCGWIDKKDLRLQKAEDKARMAHDKYKHESMKQIFFKHPSKEIN